MPLCRRQHLLGHHHRLGRQVDNQRRQRAVGQLGPAGHRRHAEFSGFANRAGGDAKRGGTISGAGILTGTNYDLRAGTCSAVLAGTSTLSGANTYSGPTTIDAGTFRANNTTGSATGAGDVIVNSAGTLVGTGAISGAVAVNGTISPGVNLGTLSTGTQTWNSGGHYEWDLNDAAGTAGPNPGSQHRSNTGATRSRRARGALVPRAAHGIPARLGRFAIQ